MCCLKNEIYDTIMINKINSIELNNYKHLITLSHSHDENQSNERLLVTTLVYIREIIPHSLNFSCKTTAKTINWIENKWTNNKMKKIKKLKQFQLIAIPNETPLHDRPYQTIINSRRAVTKQYWTLQKHYKPIIMETNYDCKEIILLK